MPTVNTRRLVLLIVSLALALLCVTFIFSNSLKDSVESTDQSSSVYDVINKITETLGFKKHVSHALVRNLAHIAEFALLGAFAAISSACIFKLGFSHTKLQAIKKICPAAVLCALIAVADELLQFGSEGRAPQITDAMLDILGAVLGVAAIWVGFIILRAMIQKRAEKAADRTPLE